MGASNQLLQVVNELNYSCSHFEYDFWNNLVKGEYEDRKGLETIYKAPDAIGNLFKTPDRKDLDYDKDGKLIKDEHNFYHYDAEGNLVFKEYIKSIYRVIHERKILEKNLNIKLRGSGVE